jgi:hypothetical protein
MFQAKKNGSGIYSHNAIKNLTSAIDTGTPFAANPGIVKREIEPPKMLNGSGYQVGNFFLKLNVSAYKQSFAAGLLYQADRFFAFMLATAGHDYAGTAFSKGECCRSTDSRSSTGYKNDFACK